MKYIKVVFSCHFNFLVTFLSHAQSHIITW